MTQRKVITEMIGLYRDLPCLWDQTADDYKNTNRKKLAWEVLVAKWKEIEPDANVVSVKKKIENLRASYKREVKKIKHSKGRTDSVDEVHKPNLWYFNLLSFISKKDKKLEGAVGTLSNRNDARKGLPAGRNRRNKSKKTAHDPLHSNPPKSNSFGIYVGEQMDSLSTQQRQIAEKLISEVIFLAKTESLNLSSKVESHTIQRPAFFGHCSQRFPTPQSNSSSPQYVSLASCSPHIAVKTELSPEYESSHSSSSSFQMSPSSFQNILSTEEITPDITEVPTGSLLKELLISKSLKD